MISGRWRHEKVLEINEENLSNCEFLIDLKTLWRDPQTLLTRCRPAIPTIQPGLIISYFLFETETYEDILFDYNKRITNPFLNYDF